MDARSSNEKQAPQVVILSPEESAPEVAPSSLPVSIRRDNDGLQAIDNVPPELVEKLPSYQAIVPDQSGSSSTSKRRAWVLASVLTVILITALALGLGFGITVLRHSHTLPSSPTNASANSNSLTATKTTSPPPSTTSAVTSGFTGIAAYSCNSTTGTNSYTTPNGAVFREECYITYHKGTPSHNSSSIVADVLQCTTYSFQECMDRCDQWNSNATTETHCGAVTYNANLTYAIEKWQANCWFKNARGVAYAGNWDENHHLVESDYIVSS